MEYAPAQSEIAERGHAVAPPPQDGRSLVSFEGSADQVQGWCLQAVGRFASSDLRWVMFIPPDRVRGLCCILHNFSLNGDAELIPIGTLGQLHRDVRNGIAWWCFNLVGLNRITVRIRARDRRFQELARRLGLRHEGTQRDFYGPGEDCSLWGLTHAEARHLLLERGRAAAPASSNERMH